MSEELIGPNEYRRILDGASEFLISGIPVYRSDSVPLVKRIMCCDIATHEVRETGEVTEVLYWKIGGAVVVHPDRWDAFVSVFKGVG